LFSRCGTRQPQLDESHRTNVTLDCQTATCAPNVRGNPKSNGRLNVCKGELPLRYAATREIVALPNETQ